MNTGFLPIFCYLFGMLVTAVLLARAIRRIMGVNDASNHVDSDSARDADLLSAFIVIGAAALWPATLPMFLAYRFIPASTPDVRTETYGVDLILTEHPTRTD